MELVPKFVNSHQSEFWLTAVVPRFVDADDIASVIANCAEETFEKSAATAATKQNRFNILYLLRLLCPQIRS
jgi:hypothetical protein